MLLFQNVLTWKSSVLCFLNRGILNKAACLGPAGFSLIFMCLTSYRSTKQCMFYLQTLRIDGETLKQKLLHDVSLLKRDTGPTLQLPQAVLIVSWA